MKHLLPPLPYPTNGLEPLMSKETLEFHYGKHHKTYVDKLNELIVGTEFEDMSLVDIVKRATGPIFNNGAQAWNHSFFWDCLTPSGSSIDGELRNAIDRDFGSLQNFFAEFNKQAVELFGSGWIWLVRNEQNKLLIETTSNADNPMRDGRQPLLVCDLWEHAYYVDYRNERAKFLDAFSKIVNWGFVARNFSSNGQLKAAA